MYLSIVNLLAVGCYRTFSHAANSNGSGLWDIVVVSDESRNVCSVWRSRIMIYLTVSLYVTIQSDRCTITPPCSLRVDGYLYKVKDWCLGSYRCAASPPQSCWCIVSIYVTLDVIGRVIQVCYMYYHFIWWCCRQRSHTTSVLLWGYGDACISSTDPSWG